ncbi:MAG: DUF3383 family protein [Burkholderiaceae bacterium]
MANLSSIVNVLIALNTAAVQRGTFGIPLIACPLASFTERVRTYTSPDGAAEDNLPPEVMAALNAAFSQIPRPAQIKVGRMAVAKVAFTPSDVLDSSPYSLTIGGNVVQYTSDADSTRDTIVSGIVGAITNAAIPGVTASAGAGVVELTFTGDLLAVTKFQNLEWSGLYPSNASSAVSDDLSAINDENSQWYGLVLAERTKQRQLDAAAWVEAREKLFVTASAEAAILDASSEADIVSMLNARQNFRTAIFYHALAATEYPDAAIMARVFTIAPGGETWALKRLGGVSPDKLSETNRNTIISKGGNTFEFYQPQLALTNPGKTAAGEWIDVIRFRDWLSDYIQTSLVAMMVNRNKVPYTDAGLQLIGNNVRASLREGQKVGGIAPDEIDAVTGDTIPGFVLTIPRASEIDANTKASRKASLSFTARLAGAIHAVEVTGALAYELN